MSEESNQITRRQYLIAGGAIGVVVIGGIAYYYTRQKPSPTPSPTPIPQSIEYQIAGSGEVDIIQAETKVEEFHKVYSDIKVNMTRREFSLETFIPQFMAGSPPDTVFVTSEQFAAFREMSAIEPLDQFFPGEIIKSKNEFGDLEVELCSYQGVMYYLPFATKVVGYQLRTDKLADYGYDATKVGGHVGTTWDEYLEMLEILHNDGHYAVGFSLEGSASQCWMVTSLMARGNGFYLKDMDTAPRERVAEFLGFLNEIEKFFPPGYASMGWGDFYHAYGVGDIWGAMSSMALFSNIAPYVTWDLDGDHSQWTSYPIGPSYNDNPVPLVNSTVEAYPIFRRSDSTPKRMEAVWKFIEFACSKEMGAMSCALWGEMPARKDTTINDMIKWMPEDTLPSFTEWWLPNSFALKDSSGPEPGVSKLGELRSSWVDILSKMFTNQITAEEATDKVRLEFGTIKAE